MCMASAATEGHVAILDPAVAICHVNVRGPFTTKWMLVFCEAA